MAKDYNRTDRVAELMQRELATLIQREVRDPRLGIITITAVKVASDLSFAKIYITQLDDNKPIEQTLKILNKLNKFLRFRLANTIELRIIPQLRFVYDASVSEGNRLLILQAIIVTLLSCVFILMPSVNSAYWLLSVMTSQLGVGFYVFMFAAALRLHYKAAETPRTFRIPGGKLGIWLTVILGIASCIFTFAVGFIPPPGIEIGSLARFETLLIAGVIVFCLPPVLIRKWRHN